MPPFSNKYAGKEILDERDALFASPHVRFSMGVADHREPFMFVVKFVYLLLRQSTFGNSDEQFVDGAILASRGSDSARVLPIMRHRVVVVAVGRGKTEHPIGPDRRRYRSLSLWS